MSTRTHIRQDQGRGSLPEPGPLLERQEELARLDSLAEGALAGAGAVAVVEGPAGIGKSSLLEAAVREAQARGLRPLRARGGELERDLGWRAVGELFEPALREIPASERDELLSGAAGLARAALGQPQDAPAIGDVAGSSLHGLYWLTSNLTEHQPLVIAVDDGQWVDQPSLRFLLYLAQRAGDLPLLIVVAARLGDPEADPLPLRALAALGTRIRPRTLSEDASRELLASALGAEPDPGFLRVCHELTGGNPFLLRELNVELEREGVAPGAENVARIRGVRPEAVRSAVLVRLAQLPVEDRKLAEAVAVLGDDVTLHRAATLAAVGEEAATGAAGRLGDLEILDRALPLRFAHPIVQSVVYEDIPAPRRAQLHAAAAKLARDAGEGPESVALHLLAVEPRGDPDAAGTLVDAAQREMLRGAPDAAATCLRRALAEPPGEQQRLGILTMLGQAEAAMGDTAALSRAEAALGLDPDPSRRAGLRLWSGQLLFAAGRLEGAFRSFEAGLAEAGPRTAPETVALLETGYLAMGIGSGLVGVGELEEWKLREPPPGNGRPTAVARERLGQIALASAFAPGSHELTLDLAERALDDGALLADQGVSISFSQVASCLFWADSLEAAEEAIDAAVELAHQAGDHMSAAYALFGRAQPRYWRGALSEAAADAGAAVEAWRGGWGSHLCYAGHWHAVALVDLDRLAEAEATLAASTPDDSLDSAYKGIWHAGRGRVALARGRPAVARRELQFVEEIAATVPFHRTPTVWPWRSDAAIAAALVGDRSDAERLAAEELELARGFGAPRQVGVALRATGIVRGPKEGVEPLQEAVAVLEDSQSRLELCRALVDLGALLRRAGNRTEARDSLRRGLGMAHRMGARALERRAHEELRAAGARPRRRVISGPDSLTPSERRVAKLAAGGATNREIAEQLFVSLRTVETHLTHAYGKLEISSRAELPMALEPKPG